LQVSPTLWISQADNAIAEWLVGCSKRKSVLHLPFCVRNHAGLGKGECRNYDLHVHVTASWPFTCLDWLAGFGKGFGRVVVACEGSCGRWAVGLWAVWAGMICFVCPKDQKGLGAARSSADLDPRTPCRPIMNMNQGRSWRKNMARLRFPSSNSLGRNS
jgi:hypothetical protein